MFDTLRRIVQEVSAAADIGQALDIIVSRVRQALQVDVCSVYLSVPNENRLVLRATAGLKQAAVARVQMDYAEGLVGLVAERAECLNLADAHGHPRFKFFPEIGEETFHAFLGVPIIHNRAVVGVLVVQQHEQRDFDEAQVTMLITLAAQLAGAISHAQIAGELSADKSRQHSGEVYLSGIPGAPGIGIGIGAVVTSSAELELVPDEPAYDIEAELELFCNAVAEVRRDMGELGERMRSLLPAEELALFDAYIMMLSGDTLVERTMELIRAGNWAPGALRQSIQENAEIFEQMLDPYLRERANDIWDIGRRLLTRLQVCETHLRQYPERTILVGEEISATQLAEVPREQLVGVVSVSGSGSSHVAILARAMGVPTVMGVADLPVNRVHERELVIDGYLGRIFLEARPEVKEEYQRLVAEEQALTASLRELAQQPAITPANEAVPVLANSGLLADIKPSVDSGAEGVGLYRTEVPFMVRDRFPSESEQADIYRHVLTSFADCPVILRTLDVGGDKTLPYFPIREENPFLGWRGIRISLDHPEIFLTQLRAMLKSNQGLGNLHILLPMISSIDELEEASVLLDRACNELNDEGVTVARPRLGVMIEVPSAVYVTAELARRCDFLSVGSNDLVQYLLAVDRNNARVAGLYRSLHPAVLRALQQVVTAGHGEDRPVSICGELAGDPAAVILLLGMGFDSLSVSMGSLPKIKWVVRSFTRAAAAELLQEVMTLEDANMIRERLSQALVDAGLGGLVRAGRR